MSARQALISALHLFVILAFFMAGFFFIALGYLPHLIDSLVDKTNLIGSLLLFASLIITMGFYAIDRGRYLLIRAGISVDLNLIRLTVEDCFLRQFQKNVILQDLDLGSHSRIQIRLSFTANDVKERKKLLVEVEKQLSVLLRERFGYSKPFYFIIKSDAFFEEQ